MPTTQQRKEDNDIEQHQRETLNALIGEQIINSLGTPADLLKVQVRQLWKNRYRVNIFAGVDVASARIANSFFLVTDGDNKILASTPKITKQYQIAAAQ